MRNFTRMIRVDAQYYMSSEAVTIQGISTHVVIEKNGRSWKLRLENIPSMITYHNSKRDCLITLRDLIQETRTLASLIN